MTISQAKVDLAVLYKLHQHAEAGGTAIPPADVLRLFNCHVSIRRIQLALEDLSAKGDIDREYHEFYHDEGLWQISRDGLMKVDRALRVPTSFIGRLHTNGDAWLESDEARQAVLKKLSPGSSTTPAPLAPNAILPSGSIRSIKSMDIDWTKWGTILAGIGIVVTVLLWAFS